MELPELDAGAVGGVEVLHAVSECARILAVEPDRAGSLGGVAFEADAHTVARQHRLRGVVGGKDGIETEAEPSRKKARSACRSRLGRSSSARAVPPGADSAVAHHALRSHGPNAGSTRRSMQPPLAHASHRLASNYCSPKEVPRRRHFRKFFLARPLTQAGYHWPRHERRPAARTRPLADADSRARRPDPPLRRPDRGRPLLLHDRGGPHHRDDRAERRGQDHHLQHGGGGAAPQRGPDPLRRRGHHRLAHSPALPPGHRAHLPDSARVRPPHGAREPDGGARRPARRAPVAGVARARRGRPARTRGAREGGGRAALPHALGSARRAGDEPLGRPEEAARAGTGDDDLAPARAPRRAGGGGSTRPCSSASGR